jgi:porphobilinogen synthase
MVAETQLSKDMFIYPYFIARGKNSVTPVEAMPGINRFSPDKLLSDVEKGLKSGVNKILLFGTGEEKTDDGHSSYDENSVVVKAVGMLRKQFGEELYIITDVCLCAYTTHGHCGILEHDYVQNDPTLGVLARMALAHAQAGADMVAPSDMMDGRVKAIRDYLDKHGFETTALMSYATKFASAYYGPFREAADSSPGKGDRKSYQMDYRNGREALLEAEIDEKEGADIIMVKPALAYLDIIRAVRRQTRLPVACYNVSGEYAMVKTAAAAGYLDEQKIVMENMYAFARAGAGIIISYHTREIFEKGWI